MQCQTAVFVVTGSTAVAAKVMQCRCFDIGTAGAPTDGKLFTAQEAQAYYSAVDAVLLDSYAIAGCVIHAANATKAQFCLRLYKPTCVQVLTIAVFGADAVSPCIIISFGRVPAKVNQFKVIS